MLGCSDVDQATISLLAMSYTGARYALEPATLNSVTSVPSLENGWIGYNVLDSPMRDE